MDYGVVRWLPRKCKKYEEPKMECADKIGETETGVKEVKLRYCKPYEIL